MAEFPALPLWTDAFIGDTHHLTPAECGAYIRLLMAAWRSPDCSLPSDDKTLGRMIGEPRQWPRLKATVLAFWELGEDGRLRQKRLLREYDFVTRKRTQARSAANAKWLKNNKPGIADASVEHVPCARASSTPTPTPKKERTPLPPKGGQQNGLDIARPEAPKPAASRGGKRGTRLPEDWTLSAEGRSYAVGRGFAGRAVDDMAANFTEYWQNKTGKGATKLDWGRAWQTWVRNQQGRFEGTKKGGVGRRQMSARDEFHTFPMEEH